MSVWAFALLTTLTLHLSGVLPLLNNALLDKLTELRTILNPVPQKVLHLCLPSLGSPTASRIREVIRTLQDSGANLIVVLLTSDLARQNSLLEALATEDKVVVGIPAKAQAVPPVVILDNPWWENLPRNLRVGLSCVPPSDRGMYRVQLPVYATNRGRIKAVEWVGAETAHMQEPLSQCAEYFIDFSAEKSTIPQLVLEDLENRPTARELLQGMAVIISTTPGEPEQSLHTPISKNYKTLTEVDFHSQALNSLLSRRHMHSMSWAATVVSIALTLLLCSVSLTLCEQSRRVRTATLIVSLLALAGSAFFVYGGLRFPIVSCGTAAGALLAGLLLREARDLSGCSVDVLERVATRVKAKPWLSDVGHSESTWSLMSAMVDQMLDVERSILLLADSRSHRLKEVAALHCTLQDIEEKRRELSRKPYTDAVSERRPLRVKRFFKEKHAHEEQYLVPLLSGGDVLGFWAIGIDAAKISSPAKFEDVLMDFGVRISEMLQEQEARDVNVQQVSSTSEPDQPDRTAMLFGRLNRFYLLLENRLNTLEAVVNSINAGVLIFDIFGRLIHVNDKMLDWLRSSNVTVFGKSALEVLLILCDVEPSKARDLIRNVLLKDVVSWLEVRLGKKSTAKYLMAVRSLDPTPSKDPRNGVARTMSRHIVFEVQDVGDFAQTMEALRTLTERVTMHMRTALAGVDLSASVLKEFNVPEEKRKDLASIIHEGVQKCVETMSQYERHLPARVDRDRNAIQPVDPLSVMKRAMKRSEARLRGSSVKITIKEPRTVGYVLCQAKALEDALVSIMEELATTGGEAAALSCRVYERGDRVIMEHVMEGIGIALERLKELESGAQKRARADSGLLLAKDSIQEMGGAVRLRSILGKGIEVQVEMERFV